jgi:hypothetical protein
MVETNIRIVDPGMDLSVPMRRAKVTATANSPDLLERACLRLRSAHGLAAVPDDNGNLLIATVKPIPDLMLRENDWELSVKDDGQFEALSLRSELGQILLPGLVERALLAKIASLKHRWVISGAPRYWYEPKAFKEAERISAFRRAAVSAMYVEDEGIGVAVELQTAFFTTVTLDWFFQIGINSAEAKYRRELFERLAERSHGQGTLLYQKGLTRTTCYFSEAADGITCDTTGPVRVHGKTYKSLYDYYTQTSPNLPVNASDRAVLVSFQNIKGATPVAAKFLRLRVFNDELPKELQDAMVPLLRFRREYVFSFWKELGANALGEIGQGMKEGLWTPAPPRVWQIKPPPLRFGNGKILESPQKPDDYRNYYGNRFKMLREAGCFQFPAATPRHIRCAYPSCVSDDSITNLLTDLQRAFATWTGKQFTVEPLKYDRIENGVNKVRNAQGEGMLLFVLNGDRNGYYTVSLELGEFRPKRLTQSTLTEEYQMLKQGAWDGRARAKTLQKGRNNWNSFVGLIGLDVLQLQDGAPWAIPPGPFEALLVIDVSHDRRYYGLSLLVVREEGRLPGFRLVTVIKSKVDSKEEAINPEILEEEAVKLFRQYWPARGVALESMLVLRDGRLCKGEPSAVQKIRERLQEVGILATQARFEAIEFFKDTAKQIRLWDAKRGGDVANVIEGTAVEIAEGWIALANTGCATLHHGTAEPVLLHAHGNRAVARDAATMSFYSTQLNWSNPRVAQRLPLPLSRTDEELIARSQQEARHSR